MEECIQNCLDCHHVCLEMAMNHCLETGGKHVEPAHFRLMMNCAEICQTSANFMLSGSEHHKQLPSLQTVLGPQTFPHRPQFIGSISGSAQYGLPVASGHVSLSAGQVIVGGGALVTQAPIWQTCPAAQTMPHEPQFAASNCT